jgi:hypothetical protein
MFIGKPRIKVLTEIYNHNRMRYILMHRLPSARTKVVRRSDDLTCFRTWVLTVRFPNLTLVQKSDNIIGSMITFESYRIAMVGVTTNVAFTHTRQAENRILLILVSTIFFTPSYVASSFDSQTVERQAIYLGPQCSVGYAPKSLFKPRI